MTPVENKEDERLIYMTEAEGAAKVVRESFRAQIVTVEGQEGNPETEVMILPDGKGGLKAEGVQHFLNPYRKHPERRKGQARMSELDSLIAQVNRFKDDGSALFAWDDAGFPKLTAVLDYHPTGADSAPRFCEHRALYDFPLSDEWLAWRAKDGETLEQVEFAEFLEDRIVDVMAVPDSLAAVTIGANRNEAAAEASESDKRLMDMVDKIGGKICGPGKLMELVRGLQVNDKQLVKEIVNTASGEVRLRFDSEHQDAAGKPINVPNLFLIAVPVFRNGPAYRIAVRLRYRLAAGRIAWRVQMHRADIVQESAVRECCDQAVEETGCPLFHGTTEA